MCRLVQILPDKYRTEASAFSRLEAAPRDASMSQLQRAASLKTPRDASLSASFKSAASVDQRLVDVVTSSDDDSDYDDAEVGAQLFRYSCSDIIIKCGHFKYLKTFLGHLGMKHLLVINTTRC